LSPDGSRIAIVTWLTTTGPDIDFRIRVVSPNGIGPVISPGKSPSWSPTGDEIIYSCTEGQFEQISGLCGISPDAAGQRKITPTPGSDARYSPDRSKIAFNCAGPANTPAICFATASGTTLGNTFGIILSSYRANRFAWSRESDFIAFECERPNAQICVIKPDGSGFRTVTNTSSFDTFPSLSPSSAH
jgi:Tol biopolymer transport system component